METRFPLPGRRMCLCQGKEEGRGTCGEKVKMLVRWGSGSHRKSLGLATFSERGSAYSQRIYPLGTINHHGQQHSKSHSLNLARGTSASSRIGDKYLPLESLNSHTLSSWKKN
jgi:hypothetical protein